jgi:hypothetical protein
VEAPRRHSGSRNIRRDRPVRRYPACGAIGRVEISPVNARDAGEIERAIAAFASTSNSGLIATPSGLTFVHSDLIIALAARHKLPAVYPGRESVVAGGLATYGPDVLDQYILALGTCSPAQSVAQRANIIIVRIATQSGAPRSVILSLSRKGLGVSRELVPQIEVSAFEKVQKAVKHRVAAMGTPAPLQVG